MEAANLFAADALIGERVVPRTKRQYQALIKTISKFYTDKLLRPQKCAMTPEVNQELDTLISGYKRETPGKKRRQMEAHIRRMEETEQSEYRLSNKEYHETCGFLAAEKTRRSWRKKA